MFIKKDLLLNLIREELSLTDNELKKLKEIHSETLAHVIRCSNIAKQFGVYLGLDKKNIELLVMCSLYHDMGKFTLDPSILYKREHLSKEDFNLIRGHVDYMYKGEIKAIRDSILYHHERPDGKGYKGQDYRKIHIFAKIISVIDTYDTMISKRCYKSVVYSTIDVIKEIENNLGKQFDIICGRLFIEYLKTTQKVIAV